MEEKSGWRQIVPIAIGMPIGVLGPIVFSAVVRIPFTMPGDFLFWHIVSVVFGAIGAAKGKRPLLWAAYLIAVYGMMLAAFYWQYGWWYWLSLLTLIPAVIMLRQISK